MECHRDRSCIICLLYIIDEDEKVGSKIHLFTDIVDSEEGCLRLQQDLDQL